MLNRKFAASAAALALAGGLVACSNTGTTTTSTSKETATATDTVKETAKDSEKSGKTATETVTSTKKKGDAAEGTDATTELALSSGETTLVPEGAASAASQFAQPDWGEPVSVEEVDGGWIISYDGEHYVAWNENTGGAPIWGEIAKTWINDVRDARSVGFPMAAETPNPSTPGWTQQFEEGTIEWTREDGDESPFGAIIEKSGNN